MAILLFREPLGNDHRDIVEFINLMGRIKDTLKLDQVPHYSTIHKFRAQTPSTILSRFLNRTLNLFYSGGEIVPITAIDSSGFPVCTPVIIVILGIQGRLGIKFDWNRYTQAGDPLLQDLVETSIRHKTC